MSAVTGLFRKAPVPLPEKDHLPVRRIAASGVVAAATLVAVSAASAATTALRRRAGRS